ncbi:MAG: GNAT family N-acetyltransferase [Chloroflexota bacterium]|nr:MAG: GNAT family N-acetyltransferase [Chloroflexota bacterium]
MLGLQDHEKWYRDHKITARAALSQIRSGSRVFLGSGCAEPQHLLDTLVTMAKGGHRLTDVEIVHMLTVGAAPHAARQFDRNFRHNAFFVGAGVRQAVYEGTADYTPIFLSQIPVLLRSGRMPIDVALVQVSPPDRFGYCSFGVSVEAHHAAVAAADLVIAQVNPRMPRTLGNSFVHVTEFDAIVEWEEELLEVPPPQADEVAKAIARHISRLIENGSTLQIGVGTIPNAVLHYLFDKRDLGIHTEMFSDGLIDLIETGVVNNKRKSFHPGKVVAAFCIGTRRLYDYIDGNPIFEFHPTDYTSSPLNIARNDKMVAINTALEVDITGQVCADSLGYRIYSGIGGQADFIRGAAMASGGKPIIALPSTAESGAVSRIVPHLSEGAGVVTTRGDVHYVATEYGVVYLQGKSLRERALSLISIAHPKFREELLAAAKEQKYLFADQVLPEKAVYPVEIEHTYRLNDLELFVRPVKPSDERLMQEYLYHLSERSIYQRFFQARSTFPHELAQQMVSVDYHETFGMVATVGKDENEVIVASAQWVLNINENVAELALSVADAYQRRGIGTYLHHELVRLARQQGIAGLRASVLVGNAAMRRIWENEARLEGYEVHSVSNAGVIDLWVRFS